ncbi:MAG TPA: hypothetical protein VEY09_16475 [Pyrinomonadaceae bacterium]|nr:hypothetical protein [Pyrinomonadaceae bacterium]
MKHGAIRIFGMAALALPLTILTAAALARPASGVQKMRAEEVLAKHQESLGTAESRAAVKNRLLMGEVVVSFRSPSVGTAGGQVVLASDGEMNLIGMAFPNVPSYPHEKVGFDGRDVSISYVRPGIRSTLGEFLQQHKSIVKQGLLGGSLSSAWPLYGPLEKKGKLEYSGLKKVNDRQAHALKYLPRGGSDLSITLFFDAETFQHVRTEYTRTLAAQMGATPEASSRQRESRYKLTEDFSDFRQEGALTLPHKYHLALEITLPGGSYKADWEMALSRFAYNQDMDPKSFDVDDK